MQFRKTECFLLRFAWLLPLAVLGIIYWWVSHHKPLSDILSFAAPEKMTTCQSSSNAIAASEDQIVADSSHDCVSHQTTEDQEILRLLADKLAGDAQAAESAGENLPVDFLDRAVTDKTVSFTLPDGQQVVGKVELIERDANGVRFIQASIQQPAVGSCFMQRQTVRGVAGPFVGHVIFDGNDNAWKIEPTEDKAFGRFVARKIDDVLCVKYTGDAKQENTEAGDALASPQTYPNDILISPSQPVVPLQSQPGAKGVLYLDFDGEQGPFPGWGNMTSAAQPFGISNKQIFEIWQKVAEDFLPFNLNVTTDLKAFNAASPGNRQRIIITSTSYGYPGVLGVAYLNTFNWTDETVCWAFTTSDRTISHELGHTLNLKHHGRINPQEEYYRGHGSGSVKWGPIMGSGTFSLSQWSKGEYLSANNSAQDDLMTIAYLNNNVNRRPDDNGGSLANARYLEILPDGSVNSRGSIGYEWTPDVDAFRFRTSGGYATFYINPAALGANLDIHAEIVMASDLSVIVSDNPDLDIKATLSYDLPAGEYLLRVRGTGRGDPLGDGYTNYASMGSYSITGSISNGVYSDRFSIAENSPNGMSVGTVAPRNYHDGAALTWSITSGNANGAFAIDPATGAITVANSAALNYESLSTRWDDPADFELFIAISNPSNPSLNESIRTVLGVTDVNESPTMAGAQFEIVDGMPAGGVLGSVNAGDPDRFDFPTVSIISGNPGGLFTIDPLYGIISTSTIIHLPADRVFDLAVQAVDQGNPALNSVVNVQITVRVNTGLVVPLAATAQSYYATDDRNPLHAIDGSGMSPSNPVTLNSLAANSPGGTMWLSNGNMNTWITFDLGVSRKLKGFRLWNYNEINGTFTGRGIKTAGVYTGSSMLANGQPYTAAGAAWGALVENFTFTQASGTGTYAGENYLFSNPINSRYIQLYVIDNFGTSDAYTGISEIRFMMDDENPPPFVNDPPVIAQGDSVNTENNLNGFNLTINASDPNGDALSWSVISPASHGMAVVSGVGSVKAVAYMPNVGYIGNDSFVVQVADSNGGTDAITVNVTVTSWGYAAWTDDQSSGIDNASNYTVAANFNGSVVTMNGVSFQGLAGSAASGTNFTLGGSVSSTTDDSNQITGNSATLASGFFYDGNPRTITLNNLTPGAVYETSLFSVAWENSGRTQTFSSGGQSLQLDQDLYGNNRGIRIIHTFVAETTSRILTITPTGIGTFHLYALANRVIEAKTATITELVSSGNPSDAGNSVTFTATVKAGDVVATGTGGTVVFRVDGDFAHSSAVSNGVAIFTTDSLVFGSHTVSATYSGDVEHAVSADNLLQSVNGRPVAMVQSLDTYMQTAKAIHLMGSDPDGDLLSYIILTQPPNGTITGVAPDVIYTPEAGYSGGDSFTFKVNDGRVDSSPATVSITVIQPNFILPSYSVRGDGKTVATFTSGSGPWPVPAGVTSIEVLVLGGGGAGGGQSSGGGAGGFYHTSSYPVTPGAMIEIEVGTGGVGGKGGQSPGYVYFPGTSGSRSRFDSLMAYGGTFGGSYSDGGDQGGYSTNNGYAIIPGNPGGGGGSGNYASGGGAGGSGGNTNNSVGGIGQQSAITGTLTYYGGGGGANPGGLGGSGGGGAAVNVTPLDPSDMNGVNGLGGGGGGGWGGVNNGADGGGNGGNGVVIVVYQIPKPYDEWASRYQGHNLINRDGDDDGDGMRNFNEFAFGLDPTKGDSSNPMITPLDKTTHTFRYTRLVGSGLSYTVWASTNLRDWDIVGANQTPVTTINRVETVEVMLTAPPAVNNLFLRVMAK